MIAALYVRVSTQEQKNKGLSVDNQIKALKEYCKKNKISVYKVYNDAGISAHASYKKRPALQQMVIDSNENRFDLILFTRLDRWFRSVKDYYAVMEQLKDKPWKAIWEDYDTTSSSGQFKVNIMLSVAQAEAERGSERIKAIHSYRRDNGAFVGSAPTGYTLKKIDGKSIPVKNEDAPMVDCFFKNYLETFSVTEAHRACAAAGYRLNFRLARKIAVNETYTGHKDNCTYEPYITDSQYQTIMEQRKIRTRTPKKKTNVYIFRGLLRCSECGHTLCGRVDDKGYVYYRCSHPQQTIPMKYLYASEIPVEKELLKRLDELIGEYAINVSIDAVNGNIDASIKRCEERLNRLKMLFEFGDISPEEYTEKRDALRAEIDDLSKPQMKAPELPSNWKEIYNDLDREHKRDFWRKVIDRIEINRGDAKYSIFIRGHY